MFEYLNKSRASSHWVAYKMKSTIYQKCTLVIYIIVKPGLFLYFKSQTSNVLLLYLTLNKLGFSAKLIYPKYKARPDSPLV